MRFRTEIKISPEQIGVDYHHKGLLMGSCFAENIGNKIRSLLMPVIVNPMGILFNPASIVSALESLAAEVKYSETDLEKCGDLWVSFSHHGSFGSLDKADALANINAHAKAGAEALKQADYVVLTLGTSWVYERRGRVVANCHKFPAEEFTRKRMSVEEIVESFSTLLNGCLRGKRVVLTVSPIRHLGDGAIENSVSKSTLIVAANNLCQQFGSCSYFPAYEIMVDDLRDYRFYEPDMTHPSALAVEYIWEKFCGFAVTDGAQKIFKEVEALIGAAAHRPINPGGEAHKRFVEATLKKIERFEQQYPYINIGEVRGLFKELGRNRDCF